MPSEFRRTYLPSTYNLMGMDCVHTCMDMPRWGPSCLPAPSSLSLSLSLSLPFSSFLCVSLLSLLPSLTFTYLCTHVPCPTIEGNIILHLVLTYTVCTPVIVYMQVLIRFVGCSSILQDCSRCLLVTGKGMVLQHLAALLCMQAHRFKPCCGSLQYMTPARINSTICNAVTARAGLEDYSRALLRRSWALQGS